jgi:hypothetical protein
MAWNPPNAVEQLAAFDRLYFLPCSEHTELKEKTAGYTQKRRPEEISIRSNSVQPAVRCTPIRP